MATIPFQRFVRPRIFPSLFPTKFSSSIIESKLVQFVVGPQKKEYHVHSTALLSLSKPLDCLLNGQMEEAVNGRVLWDDIDEGTFSRFIQWAYTHGYGDPKLKILSDTSSIDTADGIKTNQETGTTSTIGQDSDTDTEGGSFYSLITPMENFSPPKHPSWPKPPDYGQCNNCQRTIHICRTCTKPRRVLMVEVLLNWIKDLQYTEGAYESTLPNEKREDYSEVFLAHARLYVLADKYDIPKLGSLDMCELWAILRRFILYPDCVGDIIVLISYAFNAFSKSAEDNELCRMLVYYSACIYESLIKHNDFKLLVEQIPLFIYSLMKLVAGILE